MSPSAHPSACQQRAYPCRAPAPCARSPSARVCPALTRPTPPRPQRAARPAPAQRPCLLSQYSPIIWRYKLSLASLLYCNMIASPLNCIAIHLPPRPATSLSQYTLLCCDTISLNQTSHLLQYTRCIAIQFLPYLASTTSL